ncbi:SDR family NAD(P)-dependent oxidoreductase [Nakamurella sp. YIM 132087]|uniref:SDR family NAD(P)-dependent oxidoreductase n=1 Tax=Nakamurella alba TaxID=2665158 RepID=A0A7K1FMJ7_9ACTN|nr:SDR family NAD(P)-dependent oxidoreductase [Nakamurella alba]MTD15346.1 SDR family NAD(P)-dependent oxidoreductase [Nakamurella alba]
MSPTDGSAGQTPVTAPGAPAAPADPGWDTDHGAAVAVIGMAGRFPSAAGVGELWSALLAGTPGLRTLDEQELAAAGVSAAQLADPQYVRVGGPVPDLEMFDATVFGIGPREAETMDPQHRLFLVSCWEALESAGYQPTDVPGQVGVFGGCGFPDYIVQNVQHLTAEPGGALLLATGNERDSLTSLVSYKFGFRGPSVAVQTFCSTSLVAVHLACQSLLTYECDTALAGGAFTPLPAGTGYRYEPGGITAPDGVVRSFDAGASGTVMGSGVGVVVLKRMADAVRDGDLVSAVILGSATNNDGRVRAGYTAPGVDGQAEVVEAALGVAGVDPATVGYVECHATGTSLGDSIELAAMRRVFPPRADPCVLGTAKPMLGHLDRASGVTGLIRASLAVRHGVQPGVPGFRSPNTALATDRFTVLPENRSWPDQPGPRRAGVSSFGLGGTNAHVVLEQAPPRPARPARPGPHLLVLSATGPEALDRATARLRTHLETHVTDVDLADVAYTLQVSRGGFATRRAVVVDDLPDALAALTDPSRWLDGRTTRRQPPVALRSGESAGSAVAALAALGVTVTGQAEGAVEIDWPADGSAGHPAAARSRLLELARLWLAGSAIDWSALHGGAGLRVELPTYPFERRRYWVDPVASAAPARPVGRSWDRDDWTLQPGWRAVPHPAPGADGLREAGPWLLLGTDRRLDAAADLLRSAGALVFTARPGPEFRTTGDGFTVRVDDPTDLAALLTALPPIGTVLHGFSLGAPHLPVIDWTAVEAAQRPGTASVQALATVLAGPAARPGPQGRTRVVLLTDGAADVAGDLRHPEHAGIPALAPTITQENPQVRCRAVDLGPAPGSAGGTHRQARTLLAAVLDGHQGPAAVRGTDVLHRDYLPLPTGAPRGDLFVPGETVLITGGLGDVGLAVAGRLADLGCRLVLTTLHRIPEEGEPADPRSARHRESIDALRARGADVLALAADVADADRMREVVTAATDRFGRIDAVVHAAGLQDGRWFGFLHQLDPSVAAAHLRSKVGGLLALDEVLAGQAVDRRITLSSLAAVLGGITLGPYAAANAALDAWAAVSRRAGVADWITVDWDTWNIDANRVAGHSSSVTDFTMSPAEGVDVLLRALSVADRAGHLVISTGSLQQRLDQWVLGDIHAGTDDAGDRERHPRPELDVPYVPPADDAEAQLADIWSRVLAIEPIGMLDNFFTLGGHSLLAIELTAKVRATFGAEVPVTALLQFPTVRELAGRISAAAAAGAAATGDGAAAADGTAAGDDAGGPRCDAAAEGTADSVPTAAGADAPRSPAEGVPADAA